MPFLTSLSRALSTATLLISIANTQTCYYPDGETVSNDVPCNSTAAASSCCSADSFCLSDGLCYQGGIVSRGSCTDKTWGSPACAGYCKTVTTNAEIAITPCTSGASTNTFVCGVNSTDCQTDSNTFTMNSDTGLTLRPSQIAALVQPVLAASTPSSLASQTACPPGATSANGLYTAGQMAGLGCGLGLPLLIALLVAMYLLRQEKRRFAKPKLMYKLPDDCADEFTFRPPPAPPLKEHPPYMSKSASRVASTVTSRRGSMRTLGSPGLPVHVDALPQSFIERYETMKKTAQAQEETLASPRHELHATPKEVYRHELGDRMSQTSS